MNFTKLQGAGNDFILVETSNVSQDWSQMAMTMCDRHFGVGADGLLVLLPSDMANFRMRVFNPDGSEAEACGNGLRCLAKYVADMGLANIGAQEISVETMSGIRRVKFHKEVIYRGKVEGAKPLRNLYLPLSFEGEGDKGGEVVTIQVGMGKPKLGAKDIPVVIEPGKGNMVDIKPILSYSITIGGKELFLNFVSMGNPHAIYFWQHQVSEFPLSQMGPEIEQHKLFPNRVNFEVARVVSR